MITANIEIFPIMLILFMHHFFSMTIEFAAWEED